MPTSNLPKRAFRKPFALDGKKVNSPSYVVKKGEEDLVGFYPTSPVAKQIEEYNAAKADDNE